MANEQHYLPPGAPAQYETGPVRFNDSADDFFQSQNNYPNAAPNTLPPAQDDGRKTYNDKSSIMTGWTSGITVPLHEPLDEQGQTHAQAIVSEYSTRGSRVDASPEGSTSTPRPHNAERRPASSHMSVGDRKSMGPDSAGLSYIDENFRYYSSRGTPTPNEMNRHGGDSPTDAHDAPLVSNAAGLHGARRRDLEYADPAHAQNRGGFFGKWVDRDRDPVEQRIERRRRGIGRQRRPYVVWILTVIMISLLIYELVKNYQVTGYAFAKPASNPMIGPQSIELVSLGARFPPCMKYVADVPPTFQINCANASDVPLPSQICSIEEICGFGGFSTDPAGVKQPNQWFRFITPIFLHAGIIHLLVNMFAQVVLSGQVEKDMGSAGFTILYFAAGIFGNVFGMCGNFALVGRPSVGASGAIVGTLAVLWVDLMAHWHLEYRPWVKLAGHIINLVLVVGLGYIPGVDNFSHLGGFLMGLITGIILLPVISTTKRHRLIIWILRIAMIPLAIILFVVLIRNFYTGDPSNACSWCRYLSCIPTSSNNCLGTGLTTTTINKL